MASYSNRKVKLKFRANSTRSVRSFEIRVFYFSSKRTFCIECSAYSRGGRRKVIRGGEATGHRMCRGEGGRWLTREFKTSGIRWWCVTHDSHMRGACDVYGLLRGGRYRVSARAPNTAWRPLTRLPPPSLTPAHSLYPSIENNNRERICRSSNKMILRASFFSRSLFEIDSCIFLLQG